MQTHHLSIVETLQHQLENHRVRLQSAVQSLVEHTPAEAEPGLLPALQAAGTEIERTFASLADVLGFYAHVPTPEDVAQALGVSLPSQQPTADELQKAVMLAELEPAVRVERLFDSAERVSLPALTPTTGDAQPLDMQLELVRYVPTPEVLQQTDSAEALRVLDVLDDRQGHELVSAWTVAGNRAALTAVAVHVPGPLGDRAARALKRLPETETTDTHTAIATEP